MAKLVIYTTQMFTHFDPLAQRAYQMHDHTGDNVILVSHGDVETLRYHVANKWSRAVWVLNPSEFAAGDYSKEVDLHVYLIEFTAHRPITRETFTSLMDQPDNITYHVMYPTQVNSFDVPQPGGKVEYTHIPLVHATPQSMMTTAPTPKHLCRHSAPITENYEWMLQQAAQVPQTNTHDNFYLIMDVVPRDIVESLEAMGYRNITQNFGVFEHEAPQTVVLLGDVSQSRCWSMFLEVNQSCSSSTTLIFGTGDKLAVMEGTVPPHSPDSQYIDGSVPPNNPPNNEFMSDYVRTHYHNYLKSQKSDPQSYESWIVNNPWIVTEAKAMLAQPNDFDQVIHIFMPVKIQQYAGPVRDMRVPVYIHQDYKRSPAKVVNGMEFMDSQGNHVVVIPDVLMLGDFPESTVEIYIEGWETDSDEIIRARVTITRPNGTHFAWYIPGVPVPPIF